MVNMAGVFGVSCMSALHYHVDKDYLQVSCRLLYLNLCLGGINEFVVIFKLKKTLKFSIMEVYWFI